MLEQEIASVIKFVLDSAGNPAPYYNEVKENFVVPSIYFPAPEIDTDGESFVSYRLQYSWYIKLFHKTTEDAYAMALKVLLAIKGARNCIPLIAEDGNPAGESLRLDDPAILKLDSGVFQLKLTWDSRRPYDAVEGTPVQNVVIVGSLLKSGKYAEPVITDAMVEQVNLIAEE